ncbi:helix-turn-helix transcriptional regulator [Actinocrispum wychmicini]|uniref:Regulatory LuxR family protein n=1 Tax=Actinocrispum wychmicini TaxID=1213861 RepID=A0A4V2S831_9PSEU|nr:LuxR family transcriptional regulator [Actinocrispum wychmicini]TCO62280.1 regulatory LuxR family protein [Actinocrispum wychmicini]
MGTRALRLIGRTGEIAEVRDALTAARDGVGGSVFILGEAGVGKSRLAAEGVSLAIDAGMAVLRGRCSALGPILPFRPLTEAVLSVARQGELPGEEELGPYRSVLGRLVPEWGIADGDMHGASLVVLAEAVLRLTAVVGRGRGCLLVLEDLHDVDVETLAVIEYLIDNLDGQPTLLLATARGEAVRAVDVVRFAARRRSGTILDLRRLDRLETVALVGACLGIEAGAVPADAAELLWHNSVGNPLVLEELVHAMVTSGQLTSGPDGWRTVPNMRTEIPATLVRSIALRTDRLDVSGRAVLSAAAVLGQRFSMSVVQRVTGLDDQALLRQLHSLVAAQLVDPDEHGVDWYAFGHPLIGEALLAQLTPADRNAGCRRAAEAIGELHPGLPGDWCQLAATLWLTAGEVTMAAGLFADSGRRALADGAAGSAITLLSRAERLLDEYGDVTGRAEVLEILLYALAEANQLDRAFRLAETILGDGSVLEPRRRVALCVRLAWLASIAGRPEVGEAQVAEARLVLSQLPPTEQNPAAIDAVAAHLALDQPGPNRLTEAEHLARSALAATAPATQPLTCCQAWYAVAVIARERDLAESNACFEQMRVIAQAHRLPIWLHYGRTGPATNAWLAEGDVDALATVSHEALRVGAINVANTVDAVRTLDAVLCAEYERATELLALQLAEARRLQLLTVERYLLMTRAVLAAHQGRRPEMDLAYTEFLDRGGDRSRELPLALGMARAFCALTEENRELAEQELTAVVARQRENPTTFYLAGRHGLYPLLRCLATETEPPEFDRLRAVAAADMRWNRQFAHFADAVLLGRSGHAQAANVAMAAGLRAASRYPLARYLGLRLVADSAYANGWGEPVTWLRQAEDFFHRAAMPAVASACRAALRRTGVPAPQHTTDAERVPSRLRDRGVTIREFEVYELVLQRLANREIAARLHISPRTVEKHVASLLAKTEVDGRAALIAKAADQAGGR